MCKLYLNKYDLKNKSIKIKELIEMQKQIKSNKPD